MSELDELEATLRAAGDVWFRDELLVKLFRLIEIARRGQDAMEVLAIMDACAPAQDEVRYAV
ncbi:MAG: hypothetical protein ACLP0B_21010 [Steroidobacteraceae bacterium]